MDYYIASNEDPDFQEDDTIYDALRLDELNAGTVPPIHSSLALGATLFFCVESDGSDLSIQEICLATRQKWIFEPADTTCSDDVCVGESRVDGNGGLVLAAGGQGVEEGEGRGEGKP